MLAAAVVLAAPLTAAEAYRPAEAASYNPFGLPHSDNTSGNLAAEVALHLVAASAAEVLAQAASAAVEAYHLA